MDPITTAILASLRRCCGGADRGVDVTWQAILTSAADAAHRLATASARRLVSLTGAASGPAATIKTPPENGIAQPTTPDLTARALRLHNRSKDAAERYQRLHKILNKGR